jgi:hypothetical protein
MAKEFYTERDIEDMWKRGVMSLQMGENVVLTDLAYEKAQKLGLQLLRPPSAQNPAEIRTPEPPAAPVRPYLSQSSIPAAASATIKAAGDSDLPSRIRAAVAARMGTQVDPQLLESIIQKVLKSTGVK